jgi:hypothetical protein
MLIGNRLPRRERPGSVFSEPQLNNGSSFTEIRITLIIRYSMSGWLLELPFDVEHL